MKVMKLLNKAKFLSCLVANIRNETLSRGNFHLWDKIKIIEAHPQPQPKSTSTQIGSYKVISWSTQPSKLIFGMQPYFDPTRWNMWGNLNFCQTEDNLNFVLGNLGRWFLVCNIVSSQLDKICKTTSIFF